MPELVEGRGSAEVEGDHALVGVPDVHHPVGVLVGGLHLEALEKLVPALGEPGQAGLHRLGGEPGLDDRSRPLLVEDLASRRVELLLHWVLGVAEHEDDLALLMGAKLQAHVVRAVRGPAVRDRAARLALLHRQRTVPAAVRAEEGVAVGVEAGELGGAGEEGKVVAPLAVLGPVVDDAAVHLHLAGREVALKIGGVVLGVPQAELHRGEDRQRTVNVTQVGQPEPPDLEGLTEGDVVQGLGPDAPVARGDHGVREAMTALVVVEDWLGGLP